MVHKLMTAPTFAKNFQAKIGTEWQKQNTSNTYLMGPNLKDNFRVTAHAPQVYVYAPPAMLHMF